MPQHFPKREQQSTECSIIYKILAQTSLQRTSGGINAHNQTGYNTWYASDFSGLHACMQEMMSPLWSILCFSLESLISARKHNIDLDDKDHICVNYLLFS